MPIRPANNRDDGGNTQAVGGVVDLGTQGQPLVEQLRRGLAQAVARTRYEQTIASF